MNGSYAQGINNLGQIVGSLYDAAGNSHAYLLAGGQFTAIPQLFQANAINDAGQIVGFGYDANNIFRSFLLSNGVLTPIDVPGAGRQTRTGSMIRG